MDIATVGIVALGFVAYVLVSGRLDGTPVTAPMLFIAFGFLIGAGGFGVAGLDTGHGAIHVIAEATLILVLFTDATRIKLARLRRQHTLPVRMLAIGLPLVIALGTLTALGVFPELLFWEAALLAAILAPTDAALGQAVVADANVPVRIRQALNVESGLNDGIALPAVLLFAALASMTGAADHGDWLTFGLLQVTLGPVAGGAVGWLGARLLDIGIERGRVSEASQGIGILATAVLTFAAAELIGGNGFIAAFVGGLVFGETVRHECRFLYEFMETEGELLLLLTFLLFGAAMLPEALAHLNGAIVGYAVLSLTVVRMLPIALSLLGSRVKPVTILFLGWFGPRGLASILFALLIVEEAGLPAGDTILTVTVVTVGLSALLHGATAAPFARRYAMLASRAGECEESKPVPEMPLRTGMIEPAEPKATHR
ncbi:MAG: cation:proton antiporter [Pseudomonadota bacterium]